MLKNGRGITGEEWEFLKKNDHYLGGIQIVLSEPGGANPRIIRFGPPEEYLELGKPAVEPIKAP